MSKEKQDEKHAAMEIAGAVLQTLGELVPKLERKYKFTPTAMNYVIGEALKHASKTYEKMYRGTP
jgi:hypothetical protein